MLAEGIPEDIAVLKDNLKKVMRVLNERTKEQEERTSAKLAAATGAAKDDLAAKLRQVQNSIFSSQDRTF